MSVRDHHLVSSCELPHEELLRSIDNLRKHERVMSAIRSHLDHPDGLLVGLVLSAHGFDQQQITVAGYTCARTVFGACRAGNLERRRWKMRLWFGEMSRTFDTGAAIDRAGWYTVRVNGHVITLESRNIRIIPSLVQHWQRGRSVVFASDKYFIGQELPLAVTVCRTSLPSSSLGKENQLRQNSNGCRGTGKHQGNDATLVNGFSLARNESASERQSVMEVFP